MIGKKSSKRSSTLRKRPSMRSESPRSPPGEEDGADGPPQDLPSPLFPRTPNGPFERRFWFKLFEQSTSSTVSNYISAFIFLLIILSSGASFVETLPPYKYPNYGAGLTKNGESLPTFGFINTFCMWIFTIEYFIRFCTVAGAHPVDDMELEWDEEFGTRWGCTEEEMRNGVLPGGFTKWYIWLVMPLTIIDFLAILPFVLGGLLPLFTSSSGEGSESDASATLRIFRMFRVFRVLKLQKQTIAIAVFINTIIASAGPLMILGFFLALCVLVFGSVIFLFEQGDYNHSMKEYIRPDQIGYGMEKTSFTTTFMAMYWVMETVTTVGYGDLYPTTTGGRLVGSFCIVLGIIVFAMPITIIGDTFATEYETLANETRPEDPKWFTEGDDTCTVYRILPKQSKHSPQKILGRFPYKLIDRFIHSEHCKQAFQQWLIQRVEDKKYNEYEIADYIRYISCDSNNNNPDRKQDMDVDEYRYMYEKGEKGPCGYCGNNNQNAKSRSYKQDMSPSQTTSQEESDSAPAVHQTVSRNYTYESGNHPSSDRPGGSEDDRAFVQTNHIMFDDNIRAAQSASNPSRNTSVI